LKIATAPDDVWDKYIAVSNYSLLNFCSILLSTMQANKKAKIWRTKSFPLFDSIQIIVDGIIATGANTFRAGTTVHVPAPEHIFSTPEIDAIASSDEEGKNSDEV
jgi:hypothetical protein